LTLLDINHENVSSFFGGEHSSQLGFFKPI